MRRSYNIKTAVKRHSIIRDAYGFEVSQNLAGLYSEHSATWTSEEKRRTDKWLQFLKDICPPEHQKKNVIFAGFWDDVLEESLRRVIVEQKSNPDGCELGDRLDSLVQLGIPSFLRGYAWGLFLGYDTEKTPGLFKLLSSPKSTNSHRSRLRPSRTVDDDAPRRLLRTFSSTDSKELESLDENDTLNDSPLFHCEQALEQINKDLDRTFPGHPLMDESGKDALRQILVAFSLHRPDIGYCQGMNFISGLLLLFHQPEDAFWNLSSIIEHLLPNQFDRDMLPAVVDKLVFSHLVQHHFPDLARHLDELAVDVSYLCPHWFLCCFVNALPMETCLRVWDILFWERKPNVLFKVALALVDFYSQDLMEIRNAANAWEQLQKMAASFFDSSRLIQTACLKFDDVDESCIRDLRSTYLDRIKEQSIKDLLGKNTNFGADDASTTTTPTKILAASASLVRDASVFSSTSSSTIVTKTSQDAAANLRGEENQRVVRDLLIQLQDANGSIPDDVSSRIHDLIDRLVETESESRDAQTRLDAARKEIAKANESNRSLKSRLGAVYTELDKKNECLDRMIAKSQILTEKVAAQEEVICKQKRFMANQDSAPPGGYVTSTATRVTTSRERGTQSLKNLFALRR